MSLEQPSRVSLVDQLFRRMILLLAAIVVVICAMMFWTTQDQINTVHDGQLITGANVLRALMSDEIKEAHADRPQPPIEIGDEVLSREDRQAFDAYGRWRMFRIWKGGRLALASDTGPAMSPPASGEHGFATIKDGDKTWRVFSLPLREADVIVQVGERTSIRWVFVNQILLELALPLLLLIPASLALVRLSLADGLRALHALVREISRRGSRELGPLETQAWPKDLQPLAQSVNDLLRRLDESYEHERRFIDNAAHQLRTPLAALSLQAQLIGREEDPVARAAQAADLRDSVARAAELTEQLLTLARLGGHIGKDLVTDLKGEASRLLAESAVIAAANGVDLALEGDAPPMVKGDPALVRLILSNLIENALNHAPASSEVQVILSVDQEMAHVVIADRGTGIPVHERERVFERFFRGAGSRRSGAGLGLAIVAEAARVLDGVVTLKDRAEGAGLEARLSLPIAP